MKLIEAIIKANKESSDPLKSVSLDAVEYIDSLPIVILTCIDPRLNKLFPDALGLPEDMVVWLRNAGNIITGPFSSTTRSIALACAIKQGREIAVIGHTDCLVGKSTVLTLTEQFKALGIDRSKLPDNIVEFFGLFASERQNVIKSVEFIRHSPLISPKIPVHGLMINTSAGRLEVVVNGYETLGAAGTEFTTTLQTAAQQVEATASVIQDLQLGQEKVADTKIGEFIEKISEAAKIAQQAVKEYPEAKNPVELAEKVAADYARFIIKEKLYKVIGADNRVYGPVSGLKIIEWLNDGRIGESTPIQMEGTTEWQPIKSLTEKRENFPAQNISSTIKRLKRKF
ncbi:MAG: carbonic anhydrase [Verrucomicrobiia bacterium]